MRSLLRRKSRLEPKLGALVLGAALALGVPTAHAGPLKGAPAPFDKGGVKIALVNYLSTGDFFQAYEAGAQKQARALGVDLRIYEGRQDAAEQREQIQQAISIGVSAIIVNHGLPESLKDVVQRALDKGIKVVAFDVDLANPKVPQIEQNDRDLANLLLDQAVKDNGDAFSAGYVYVVGSAPLDRRDAAWRDFKRAHPKVQEKARWGTVDNPIAQSVANQAAAVYRANPDIRVVFAPYDEFARGAKLAADEARLSSKIRIYSADVSTADIEAIRAPNSAWVATAATNPAVVGAVSVRAAALLVAGQNPGARIAVKPTLITRDDLVKNDIHTVAELGAKFPAFRASDAATAAWIPALD
ncbi:substrate-binding domain-containing protein [Burkholderia cenocepacia]|uniref:Transport system component n=1 Tax=Burkholderia cenocepacia (strain ATCC BAA-245 / DSM 16553 / LMG 16656 / NCTC 13227 / J2315 / CF5610) TaxID=216591 RepID=B4ENI4_BURCJ|nr:substrate-binding domain-containing protein [Burkholderia cenocepacia]KIS50718.1 periplasmic binding domain protein [Burkholderia cepacia]EPZ85110.1 periplasmic-binding protein domain protein [Burkholderia cenocepacia K56-2Valvano]ERI28543.1 periplasmic-binding protein domain protein [Burkholderia cenocepacia BC7]KKI82378.1 sugar ABC transporter substrate-binding protein [Burkholderia cenocepacia]ONR62263.1 sugar ABC transporter substrate-binding protein [Burkholderia cenocepacia]